MKQFLLDHNKSIKAEWLKLSGTGMFYFCFAAAAFIPLIRTLFLFLVDSSHAGPDNTLERFLDGNIGAFCSFFYPLFLVVLVTRIVYMEHRSDTWKLLETQPVSRFSIFITKWEVAVFMSLLCLAALFVFSISGGELFHAFKRGKNFNLHLDWGNDLRFLVRIWCASLALISIQYFFSLLIKSFAWPVIIGLIAIVAGSIITALLNWNWFPYSGTSLSSSFPNGSSTGSFFIPHEILSLLWSALFLWLAFMLFSKKKFLRAYIVPWPRLASSIAALLTFSILFWYINRPVTTRPYGKTVIAGIIHLDKPVEKLVVLKYPLLDTIVVIPISNGQFHRNIDFNIEPAIYLAVLGNSNTQLYFGTNDSLYIDWSAQQMQRQQIKVTGSRIAENAYLSDPSNQDDFRQLNEFAAYYSANDFSEIALATWDNEKKKIDHFKTVDNIKLAKDFTELEKKLSAVELLTITEVEYPRVFSVYHPNDTLKYSPELTKLGNLITLNDKSLASYPSYGRFVSSLLDKEARQKEQSFLSTLMLEVPEGAVRNYIAFDQVRNILTLLADSTRREYLMEKSMAIITDEKLRQKLISIYKRTKHFQRGKKAPDFIAESLLGTTYSLASFANRYVIIDVWASWCIPCKNENPYFEQYADQYTNERIAFVSISIDQDKRAWLMEAGQRSKRVLQLWARNAQQTFAEDYSIAAIPRFILIDPKGNILNAEFPRPSDPEFEIQLQNEIPSLRLTSY